MGRRENLLQQTESGYHSNDELEVFPENSEQQPRDEIWIEQSDNVSAQLRTRADKRLEYKMTSTFLFISIVYVLVSSPLTICLVLAVAKPELLSNNNFFEFYYNFQLLYGISFLINPYLFAFQNV